MARPIAEDFGRAFRRAYESAGLTQVELVKRLNAGGWTKVDQPLVSRWARGLVKVPVEILPAVDEACGEAKGYVLWMAGYVDVQGLAGRKHPDRFSQLPGRRDADRARKPRAV